MRIPLLFLAPSALTLILACGGKTHNATATPPVEVTSQACSWNLGQNAALFAYQDGTGPWTAVTGNDGVYDFNVASATGAVAMVYTTPSQPGAVNGTVFYASASGLANPSLGFPFLTLNNLTASGTYELSPASSGFSGEMGYADFQAHGGVWTAASVAAGPQDLLGLGTTFQALVVPQQLIIHRDVKLQVPATPGIIQLGTEGDFDFSATDGSVINIASSNFQLKPTGSAANSTNLWLDELFTTPGCPGGVLLTDGPGPLPLYYLPSGSLQPGDQYQLALQSTGPDAAGQALGTLAYTAVPGDLSLDLPADMTPPTVATTVTAPYLRPTATCTFDNTYGAFDVSLTQGITNWNLVVQSGYGTAPVTFPDLSALSGWNAGWALTTGTPITVDTTGIGQTWTSGAPPEGAVMTHPILECPAHAC